MTGRGHPGVDAYIAKLPDWQQSICEQLREIVRATDPEIEETIKRTVQPYFVLDGNVCALLATKDHVNLFLYDPTVSDPAGVINQGHDNLTGRSIQVYRDDEIDRDAITGILGRDRRAQPAGWLASAGSYLIARRRAPWSDHRRHEALTALPLRHG